MNETMGQADIVVKLLSSGRYIWSIGLNLPINQRGEGIKIIKNIDDSLKREFPLHAQRSSGRISNLEEE